MRPHTMLPWIAREQLRRAAQTEIPPNNPMARRIAIEAAVALIKLRYPECFVVEQYDDDEN